MSFGLRGHRAAVVAIVALALAAVVLVEVWPSDAAPHEQVRHGQATARAADTTITIGPTMPGPGLRPGFLGFSFEYWALENYAGLDPHAVNPVLVRLIRNLVPDQTASIRIGGVTSDRTWWPVAGVTRPPGAHYILTRSRLAVAKALAQATGARLILGIQFEANSPVEAAAESRAMIGVIGRRRIAGFELGNEPERYAFAWFYKRNGVKVFGRPSSWQFGPFLRDYARIAHAMGSVPLAGPAIGSYSWMLSLGRFLRTERVSLVTLHRYPLQSCAAGPGAPNYPTIGHLLSQDASVALADKFAPFVAMAHAHGRQVRNAEMNSVSCGDAHGVANTFASALWALDALFGMARIGVDGVNIHTYSGAADQLFSVKRPNSPWHVYVAPEYYGVLMFSQAAPPGARFLKVSGASSIRTLRVWATRAPNGRIHVVLINDAQGRPETLTVRVPGKPMTATLERLQARTASSTGGVKLGGRGFGSDTTTGRLRSASPVRLASGSGAYVVRVPAASAAMLTLG
jgi:hypothetical protein